MSKLIIMISKNPYRNKAIREAILFMVILVIGVIYVRFTWKRFETDRSDEILQNVRSIIACFPKEDLKALEAMPRDIEKPQYKDLKKRLEAIISVNSKARFAYVFIERDGKIYFLADSEPEYSKDCSPPGQEYTEASAQEKQPFSDGKELITNTHTDRWGTWVSVYIPVKDDLTGNTLAVFGMDFHAKAWDDFIIYEVIESTVLFVLLLLAFYFMIKIKSKNELLKYDISERKQLDTLFKDIVDKNPMSIQIVDKEGYTLTTNPAHTLLFGSAPPPNFSIFADLENKGIGEFIRLAKSGEVVHLPDLYYNAHDIVPEAPDKSVWIRAVIFPLKDIDGKMEQFVFMHENITESKLAESELREMGNSYLGLFNSIKQAIYIQNPDLTFINVNQGAIDMYGYESDYFIGKTPEFLSAPGKNDLDKVARLVSLAFEGNPQNYEFWGIKKDGTVFPKDVWTVKGKYFGKDVVITLATDITERKRAEEELSASKLFTEEILNAINVRVFWKDRNLVYLGCNDIFARDAGFNSSNDIIGKDDFMMGWREQAEKYRNDDQHVIESGLPRLLLEETQTTPEGNLITLLTSKKPLLDSKGEIIGVLGSYLDITKRKYVELEREVLLEIMRGIVIARDLKDFLKLAHHSIAKVIYAENFFVILHNSETGLFEEVYSVDKFDPPAPPSDLVNSISAYVFRSGEPLLLTQQKFDELEAQGEMKMVGANSPSWLGVPLKTSSRTIGVIVVQDYTHTNRYTERDKEFLFSIAGQIALVVELKQGEDLLRLSEERYRTIVDNIGEGIGFVDRDEEFIFANRAAEEIFGVEPGCLVGMNLKQFVHQDDFIAMKKETTLRSQGKTSIYESDIYRPNGEKRSIIVTAVPQRDKEGSFVGTWGVFLDITARKQVEEALRISEEQQRFILESLPVAIFTAPVDPENDTSWISGDVKKITGFEIDEYLSEKDFWRKRLHPEDMERVLNSFRRKPLTINTELEYRWKCKDGTYRWFQDRSVLMENETHREYLGVIIDITERKKAEEEIHNLNSELEQRVKQRTFQLENTNNELEAFSYSVSHDLRAPLRGIDGWSLALLEDYNHMLDDKGREYLNRVRRESQRMGFLIDDLLKLSRVNRSQMRKTDLDISALVQTIADRIQESHPGRQCEFSVQPGLIAHGDPKMLEIALVNLIENACKFTGTTGQAKIAFGLMDNTGTQTYYLKDNGVGFDMENAKKTIWRLPASA